MIAGNQTWQNALLQESKQALYILEISDYGVVVASFTAAALDVTSIGYGNAPGYGAFGYGT